MSNTPTTVDSRFLHLATATQRPVLEAIQQHGSMRAAAKALGVNYRTVHNHFAAFSRRLEAHTEVQVAPAPTTDEPIEELIARKKAGMQRSMAHEEWAKLIPVTVNSSGPIGLFLVGDPHIDDDHCDIERLEADLTTVGKTKGMYAGHIGDLTNNWVGRLQALYAAQSTTFNDGLRLMEWMLDLCPNLFVVGGNHDFWARGMDLLRFVSRQGVLSPHGARMELTWPDGKKLRIHARHDFPGRSQYSDTHGMKRELLFGHRDHVLVAGHTHVDEARAEPSIDGEAHWLFRISGYKVIDSYAKEHHFRPKRFRPGVLLILDPDSPVPADRVKPYWDIEYGADFLTFLRNKRRAR